MEGSRRAMQSLLQSFQAGHAGQGVKLEERNSQYFDQPRDLPAPLTLRFQIHAKILDLFWPMVSGLLIVHERLSHARFRLHGSTLFRAAPNETKAVHAERRYKIMGFLFEASVLDVYISVQPRKPFLEI